MPALEAPVDVVLKREAHHLSIQTNDPPTPHSTSGRNGLQMARNHQLKYSAQKAALLSRNPQFSSKTLILKRNTPTLKKKKFPL
jgi:hypothetical protein